jgi:RimJ/RimL family protein N-acetyltransferase
MSNNPPSSFLRLGTVWGTVRSDNKGMLALGRRLGFTVRGTGTAREFELSTDLNQLPRDVKSAAMN